MNKTHHWAECCLLVVCCLFAAVSPAADDLETPSEARINVPMKNDLPDGLAALRECITTIVDPAAWEDAGGACRLRCDEEEGWLEVTAPIRVRRKVQGILFLLKYSAEEQAPVAMPRFKKENAAALKALSRPVRIEVIGNPLCEVMDMVGESIGARIHLDLKAFEEMGIDKKTPITVRCDTGPAADVLARILRGVDGAVFCCGDTLVVTTRERMEDRVIPAVFDIGDLAGKGTSGEIAAIRECITTAVRPVTWDVVGGSGSIATLRVKNRVFLVVSQNEEVLHEIAWVLGAMRKVRQSGTHTLRFREKERVALWKALDREGKYGFVDTPLEDVLANFQEYLQVPFYVDQPALDAANFDAKNPLSLPDRRYRVRDALRKMLNPAGLDAVLWAGAITVTSRHEAINVTEPAVFEVGDLLPGRYDTDDVTRFVQTVVRVVEPVSWDYAEGPGSISTFRSEGRLTLVVAQRQDVLDDVAQLFDALRDIQQSQAKAMTLDSKLSFTIRAGEGGLMALTAMPNPPVTALHDVTDLVENRNRPAEELVAAVRRDVAPKTWSGREWWRGGVACSLKLSGGQTVLIVRNENRVIDEVASWLEQLRARPQYVPSAGRDLSND